MVSLGYKAENVKALVTVVLVALASASLGQEAKSAASLQWANVSSGYHRFEDIQPKLVNNGGTSIFLSRLWPDGSARLQRFNQDIGNWETGEWGITCGSVAQPTVPIEIKPHSQQKTRVYWQLSTDNGTLAALINDACSLPSAPFSHPRLIITVALCIALQTWGPTPPS